MARRTRRTHPDAGNGHRTARVGQLIRRIVAEAMEQLDDDRLSMVSVTGVDVDRDLHRAVVWFTSLGDTDDGDVGILEAFEEHGPRLRREVGDQTRLRKTPMLVFRPDEALRSAERIERLLEAAAGDAGGSGGDAVSGSGGDAVSGSDGSGGGW